MAWFWFLLILGVVGFVIYRADKKLKERFQDKFNPNDWDLSTNSGTPDTQAKPDTVLPAAVQSTPSLLQKNASLAVVPKPALSVRYEVNSQLFSLSEQQLFFALQTSLGNDYVILAKLPLASAIQVKPVTEAADLADLQVDFALCDKRDLSLVCALALGHNERLAGICKRANLPLIQLPRQQEYDAQPIREQVLGLLNLVGKADQPGVDALEVRQSDAPLAIPLCPKCASVMLKRTAKSGPQAGKVFWACSNYPTCKGLIAVD